MGLSARWASLPRSQRLMLAVGAPVVAAVALWRRRTGPPAGAVPPATAAPSTATIDPGAVGVAASASDFGGFANAWADNLGALQSRVTQVEADLAQGQATANAPGAPAPIPPTPAGVPPVLGRIFRDAISRGRGADDMALELDAARRSGG